MKCTKCNHEVVDGALFCTHCGTKIEKVEAKKVAFCTNCGEKLKEGALFCVKCGTKIGDVPEATKEPESSAVINNTKSKVWIFPLILIFVLLIIVGILVFLIVNQGQKKNRVIEDEVTTEFVEEEAFTQEVATEAKENDPLAGITCNLRDNKDVTFEGYLKQDEDRVILSWDNSISVGDVNASSQVVCLNDAKSARIEAGSLPNGLLESIGMNEKVKIHGTGRIEGYEFVITAADIHDASGADLAAGFDPNKVNKLNGDYIIPDSDSRLLTKKDVKGLTLQEINYAKNEIYARHGRMFDSRELQDYFNSKSWYNGIYLAEDFKESYLSDIENKNAAFLKKMEEKNGGPYELDK